MSANALPSDGPLPDAEGFLAGIRLRLEKALRNVQEVELGQDDSPARLRRVADELREVREDLLVLSHFENDWPELERRALEIDARTAAGWVPKGESAAELVQRLKAVTARGPEAT